VLECCRVPTAFTSSGTHVLQTLCAHTVLVYGAVAGMLIGVSSLLALGWQALSGTGATTVA